MIEPNSIIQNNWQHIFPLDDLGEHELKGFYCECEPQIDWENELVIHHSFDNRELIEEVEEILNNKHTKKGK